MRHALIGALLTALMSTSASAAWCVWPGRPDLPPHPCVPYGGVPVAPAYGRWDGPNWIWGPGWGPPAVRVVPRWQNHDWAHTHDWR